MASRSSYDTVARAYADGVRSLLTPTLSAVERAAPAPASTDALTAQATALARRSAELRQATTADLAAARLGRARQSIDTAAGPSRHRSADQRLSPAGGARRSNRANGALSRGRFPPFDIEETLAILTGDEAALATRAAVLPPDLPSARGQLSGSGGRNPQFDRKPRSQDRSDGCERSAGAGRRPGGPSRRHRRARHRAGARGGRQSDATLCAGARLCPQRLQRTGGPPGAGRRAERGATGACLGQRRGRRRAVPQAADPTLRDEADSRTSRHGGDGEPGRSQQVRDRHPGRGWAEHRLPDSSSISSTSCCVASDWSAARQRLRSRRQPCCWLPLTSRSRDTPCWPAPIMSMPSASSC